MVLIPTDDSQDQVAAHVAADWSPVVVFEAAGSGRAVETALHMVANGGSVVAVGLANTAVSIVPLRFVRRGLSLLGSLIYDHPDDFRRTIDLVRSGQVQPGAHVSQIMGLAQASDALQLVAACRTGKAVLDIGGVFEGEIQGN